MQTLSSQLRGVSGSQYQADGRVIMASQHFGLRLAVGTLALAWLLFTWTFLALMMLLLLYSLALRFETAWICVLLCAWTYYDRHTPRTGGRRCSIFKNSFIARCVTSYFPIKVVKADGAFMDPSKNYLVDIHPHGIFQASTLIATNDGSLDKAFPGITFMVGCVPAYFKVPFLRELALFFGGISAEEVSIRHALQKRGTAVFVFTGSAEESVRMRTDVYHLYLKRRGFCRVALQEGVPIVPILILGKNRAYSQPCRLIQDWIYRVTGHYIVLPMGRGIFQKFWGLLPHRVPHTVLVGAALHVDKVLKPTKAQIESLHLQHTEAIRRLYEEHSANFFPGTLPLILER